MLVFVKREYERLLYYTMLSAQQFCKVLLSNVSWAYLVKSYIVAYLYVAFIGIDSGRLAKTDLSVGQLHTVNRDYINYINITHHVR